MADYSPLESHLRAARDEARRAFDKLLGYYPDEADDPEMLDLQTGSLDLIPVARLLEQLILALRRAGLIPMLRQLALQKGDVEPAEFRAIDALLVETEDPHLQKIWPSLLDYATQTSYERMRRAWYRCRQSFFASTVPQSKEAEVLTVQEGTSKSIKERFRGRPQKSDFANAEKLERDWRASHLPMKEFARRRGIDHRAVEDARKRMASRRSYAKRIAQKSDDTNSGQAP